MAPGLAMRPTRETRADGTGLRHRSLPGLVRQTVVGRHFRQASGCSPAPSGVITMWAPRHTRKPTSLLRLSGALLLRFAARQFLGLLFHDPPRSTRDTFQAAPQAEACARSMDP